MDRRTLGSALVVLGSLFVATAAAALVVAVTAPSTEPKPVALPHAIEARQPPVIASNDRVVSPTVLATAGVAVSASAPGLALEQVQLGERWEESRAEIRDLTTGDLRAYAIGDLLPHGSLLVGISTGTADIMVGDVELVRLKVGGEPRTIEDFRTAFESQALSRAPDLEARYRAAIERSVETIGSAGAETVQAHIDELVACGDPAIEILIHHVGDGTPVAPGPYRVPAGSGLVDPNVTGDVVIAVLESITGQTFGDPSRVAGPEREEIARSWQRWWGVE